MRALLRIQTLILSTLASILGSPAAGCSLNFSAFPYSPVGECAYPDHYQVTIWNNIRSNQCCRNGLNLFSRTLANGSAADQPILLTQNQWKNCSSALAVQADAEYLKECQFGNLHLDNNNCSSITPSTITAKYGGDLNSALASCSQLNAPSFVDTCRNCTSEITNMIAVVVKDLKVDNDEIEKAICSIAVVTMIASIARSRSERWTSDYYSCLAAMDSEDLVSCRYKKNHDFVISILAIIIGLMAILLLVAFIKYKLFSRRPRRREKGALTADQKVGRIVCSGLYGFSEAEIQQAIRDNDQPESLGAGSAGRVYQGVLPSGQPVAIKHLYLTVANKSFTREVESLSKVRHPNLVSLLGYCDENGHRFLVYEFCYNGNLAEKLRSEAVLPWEKRVDILKDCSIALRFLHTHPDGCIVHRDIKLTNILLTDDMTPKLSDFGLAKMVGIKQTECFTEIRGTIGYMDPEYMTNGNLTCASDIYSFGIVILQVLSGRKVIELNIKARDSLTRAAKDVSAGRRPLTDFIDPLLRGEVNLEDFRSILRIAVLCVSGSSKGRPPIGEVVEEFEKACRKGPSNTFVQKRQIFTRASMSQQIQSPDVIENRTYGTGSVAWVSGRSGQALFNIQLNFYG